MAFWADGFWADGFWADDFWIGLVAGGGGSPPGDSGGDTSLRISIDLGL